jgi:hypothetical protein
MRSSPLWAVLFLLFGLAAVLGFGSLVFPAQTIQVSAVKAALNPLGYIGLAGIALLIVAWLWQAGHLLRRRHRPLWFLTQLGLLALTLALVFSFAFWAGGNIPRWANLLALLPSISATPTQTDRYTLRFSDLPAAFRPDAQTSEALNLPLLLADVTTPAAERELFSGAGFVASHRTSFTRRDPLQRRRDEITSFVYEFSSPEGAARFLDGIDILLAEPGRALEPVVTSNLAQDTRMFHSAFRDADGYDVVDYTVIFRKGNFVGGVSIAEAGTTGSPNLAVDYARVIADRIP